MKLQDKCLYPDIWDRKTCGQRFTYNDGEMTKHKDGQWRLFCQFYVKWNMGFLSLYVKVKMEFNQTEKFILHHALKYYILNKEQILKLPDTNSEQWFIDETKNIIQVARELKKKIGVENDE